MTCGMRSGVLNEQYEIKQMPSEKASLKKSIADVEQVIKGLING